MSLRRRAEPSWMMTCGSQCTCECAVTPECDPHQRRREEEEKGEREERRRKLKMRWGRLSPALTSRWGVTAASQRSISAQTLPKMFSSLDFMGLSHSLKPSILHKYSLFSFSTLSLPLCLPSLSLRPSLCTFLVHITLHRPLEISHKTRQRIRRKRGR